MKTTKRIRWFLSALSLAACCGLIIYAQGGGPSTDTDGDGMPDAWENLFGLDPGNAADASADYDGDGLTNLQEYQRGTDPFAADTDLDGFPDNMDSNALSRAVLHWGCPKFTSGDNYGYVGPRWFLGGLKNGGSWLTNGWSVGASDTNPASLLIDLDRAVLTNNVVIELRYLDATNSSMRLDFLDSNDVVVATDVLGNLLAGSGQTKTARWTLPLTNYPSAPVIRLRRESGDVTVFRSVLYIDDDSDGLDADQEAQLGTSDMNADTDGDGYGDLYEYQAGTNPTDPASHPSSQLILTTPADTTREAGQDTGPDGTGWGRAIANNGNAVATYTDVVSTVTTGLVAYYRFDESPAFTNAADATGNGRIGLYQGGVTPGVSGQVQRAVNFTKAESGRVAVNSPLNLFTNKVTFTAWVKRRGTQSLWAGILFSRASNTIAGLCIGTNNELRYTWNNAANTYNWNSGLTPPDGVWTFVALVVSPSNATMYMQTPGGSLQSAVNNVSHSQEEFDGALYIGQDSMGGRFFEGMIDEVGIWKRPFTSNEISTVFQAGNKGVSAIGALRQIARTWLADDGAGHATNGLQKIGVFDSTPPAIGAPASLLFTCANSTSPTNTGYASVADAGTPSIAVNYSDVVVTSIVSSLAAYFRLDETNGSTTVADSSGNNRTGTLTGGAKAGFAGQIQLAADFTKTSSSQITVSSPLNLYTNTVTFSAWVKRRGVQSPWAGVVFSRAASTVAGLCVGTNSELRYTWNNLGSTYGFDSQLVLPDGVWTFAALVVSPSNAILYMGAGGPLRSAVSSVTYGILRLRPVLAT